MKIRIDGTVLSKLNDKVIYLEDENKRLKCKITTLEDLKQGCASNDYESMYMGVNSRNIVLEQENERLTKAIINIALKI